MTFKNDLERQCFEIAQRALGGGVQIEHNKTVQIESALYPEVASFKGPPAKEVDVLIAERLDEPKVQLLVSCKLLSRPAEPAHVQEWGSVVRTMNQYAKKTIYLGLVLSPTGFTAGSESWATSHDLGLVPPIKGRRITFNEQTVLRMFERVLVALHKRVRLRLDDLRQPPTFFDLVYRLVSDFEGHQETVGDGRYVMMPQRWASSFGEMYAAIGNRTIEDLYAVAGATVLKLSGGVCLALRAGRNKVRANLSTTGACPSAGVPEEHRAGALHSRFHQIRDNWKIDHQRGRFRGLPRSGAGSSIQPGPS